MKVAAPSPEVADLLATLKHPAESTIRAVRAAVLSADARIGEGIKWNAPSYHVAGAHFATFNLRDASAVRLILHLGATPRREARVRTEVTDPAELLDWKGADRAIVAFPSEAAARRALRPLAAIVRQWITHL
jgi:hypothetical protein